MNPTSSTTAALLSATLLFAPVQAQEPRRITLDEALALYARNNLELRLARADAAEAAGLALQAAAFPNPSLVLTHEPLSSDDFSYSESYVHLSQRLEWPGTRGARRSAASRAAEAALARVAADSLRIAFAVKRAFVEAAYAEQQARLVARVVTVFREAEQRAADRLAEGDLSRYDHQRIRVERHRYEGALAQAELDAESARRALAVLVTPESETRLTPVGVPATGPPSLEVEPVLSRALERRPELRAAAASVESATAGLEVARNERIPDLTATGGLKRQSDGFTGAYIGVSLPLPLWDHKSGSGEAARARLAGSESRLALARRQVEIDVQRATDSYRSLLQRSALLEDQPAAGGDLLDIAQVAWAEGEMDLLGLLDAAAALRDAQALALRLSADLWIAYYDVERAAGGFASPGNDTENES